MLSVDEALRRMLANTATLPSEMVPLAEALGRVLAEDIRAPHDLPPFANSAMDGFAVIAADVQDSRPDHPTLLTVIEDIPAGHLPQKIIGHGQAARIMTGAIVPPGATAVVPVEATDSSFSGALPAQVKIMAAVAPHASIRPAGEDMRAGETVLTKGRRLRPADLGVLAGSGIAEVPVIRRPRVAVISTGDELLVPGEPLVPGKIYDMNGQVLPALITTLGAIPLRLGIARDTVEDVRRHFQAALAQGADLILSSAGVSVGAFDVVKTVLDTLGSADFWKVNMRPGKPITFGQLSGTLFVGLPGNPVSATVTFMVFVQPMIEKMLGIETERQTLTAQVGEAMASDGRMTFARVRLVHENGDLVAYSTGTQSSGALSSMVKADGLLIIPAGLHEVKAGDRLEVWPFRTDSC